jgi:hypothetical protein
VAWGKNYREKGAGQGHAAKRKLMDLHEKYPDVYCTIVSIFL